MEDNRATNKAVSLVNEMIHQKMNDPNHRALSNGEKCDCTKDLDFIRDTLVSQQKQFDRAKRIGIEIVKKLELDLIGKRLSI